MKELALSYQVKYGKNKITVIWVTIWKLLLSMPSIICSKREHHNR